ncbi:hypothetical protein LXA43DRAFT_1047303 [Ganoderma leucocontextum]|nr:hypothetical protein LXA43DRAFT_1047303 [Ganoderma leucocontextum]
MSIDSQITLTPGPSTGAQEDSDATQWQHVPEANLAREEKNSSASSREGSVSSSTPGYPRATARSRKTRKTVFLAQSQTVPPRHWLTPTLPPIDSPSSPSPPPPQAWKRAFQLSSDEMQVALAHSAACSVQFISSISTQVLQLLKKPPGSLLLCLVGFLLGSLFAKCRFEPVCYVPVISSASLYRPLGDVTLRPPQRVDYPRLVEIQTSSFERLLDSPVAGPALSLGIKKAEMATKDLITLVEYSELESRELLAQSLLDFVQDAKKTGRGLQKLAARINGAVDNVIANNGYALQTLRSAQAQQPTALIWSFRAGPPSYAAALDVFRKSMHAHESEMRRLILEVEVSSADLDVLDAHLDTLHKICTREKLDQGAARDALLAELWTLLGGNQDLVRVFDTNLEILRELGEYKKNAAARVAAAMQTLYVMGEDMEDLRERVAAPDLVGGRVPVEVHMESIAAGIERLKEQRTRAKEREEGLVNRILGVEN